jgi:outer membrane protein assembly factor BamB
MPENARIHGVSDVSSPGAGRPPRLMSRRTALGALAAPLLAPNVAGGQPGGGRAVVHRAPRPLAAGAVTHDWTSFLGPTHNGMSTETRLSRTLPPPLVWELPTGSGYASPAIAGDRLVYLHRVDDEEVVECLHPETGATHWRLRYASAYRDRYGYNNGPRSSPVIDAAGGRVYTVGAEGLIHAMELETGRVVWRRDLRAAYRVRQDFFGISSTPLIDGDLLIVHVGAPGGPTVAALDLETGQEVWQAGNEWGASYASPVPAVVHGERRLFVFAGGESRPPSGGLLSIDPANGRIDFAFPWRSRTYESVNAACPVVFDDKVFITASYRAGGALVGVRPDFTHEVAWTTQEFALHFNTPIHRDGYLYGFDGRNMGDSSLACVDASSGQVVWREAPTWTETFEIGGRRGQQILGTARGSLLAADGQFLCLGELGHLLWMDLTPRGYREISRAWLVAARESWALPVLSRGLLYVVQNSRDLIRGTPPRLLCYDLRA